MACSELTTIIIAMTMLGVHMTSNVVMMLLLWTWLLLGISDHSDMATLFVELLLGLSYSHDHVLDYIEDIAVTWILGC